jgi:hypothetical protein
VLLDVGFALGLLPDSLVRQPNEDDTLFLVLIIGLDQTRCSTCTRTSPGRPHVYDNHFANKFGFTGGCTVEPAVRNKLRWRSSHSQQTT